MTESQDSAKLIRNDGPGHRGCGDEHIAKHYPETLQRVQLPSPERLILQQLLRLAQIGFGMVQLTFPLLAEVRLV
jgi:hypothetical protein